MSMCETTLDLEFKCTINSYKKKCFEMNSKLYDINRNVEWRHSNDHCDGITFHFSIKQPKIQSFHELAINGWSIDTEFHSSLNVCSATVINPLSEKYNPPF